MKYDTVVIGGGLAGVCAAIAAARLGCNDGKGGIDNRENVGRKKI